MKYSVTKTKEIETSQEEVIKNIADLAKWQTWSPWACLDPNATIDSSENNMSWSSHFIGQGKMSVKSKTSSQVKLDLDFIKPFKSHADIVITLTKIKENVTLVTWEMHSKLPIFMCFFKKLFKVMIGKDFDRGLTRLKYLCETGIVPTRLEFIDTPELVQNFKIAGISSSCSMNSIPDSMSYAYKKLHTLTKKANITPLGGACFCYNVKLAKESMDYTAAVIYTGDDVHVGELKSQQIPEHKMIKVIIHGSYDFMGDAWSAAYSRLRGLKLKIDKRVPTYEVYIKGPHNTTDPAEYITEIRFPVK